MSQYRYLWRDIRYPNSFAKALVEQKLVGGRPVAERWLDPTYYPTALERLGDLTMQERHSFLLKAGKRMLPLRGKHQRNLIVRTRK